MADKISVFLFYLIGFLFRLLPIYLVRRIGKALALVFFYTIHTRRDVALHNLDICFPEKDRKWKMNIIKKSYINLSITILELLYIPRLNKKKYLKLVTVDDEGYKMFKTNNLLFFLSAHFCNWEWLALSSVLFDRKFNLVAKIQASESLNPLINKLREKFGNKMIMIDSSMRKIFKKISDKEIICFLIDQSAHSDSSVYIDFFGKKVPTFAGPAKLALRYRPEIYFTYLIRLKDYNYRICHQKIEYDDINSTDESSIIKLTQRFQKILEDVIRKYPENWLWFHKRFKHMKID
jgi:Kdo2-lipid IVA lauroyltransferase/acyltransferase